MKVKVYHNARCGTSRKALVLLEGRGADVEVVDYMKDGLTLGELEGLASRAEGGAESLVRKKEGLYRELGLEGAGEGELLEALARNPRLLNRPVVEAGGRVLACRPAERALELLEEL